VLTAGTIVALGAWSTPPARAQPSTDQIQCANQDRTVAADRMIASCTALIDGGGQSSRLLSITFYNRGLAYRSKGDHDRAIADFNAAIKADPANTFAFMSRGTARYEQGDNDGAIADYGEAVRVDPKNALAFTNRCNAYRTKGDNDRAIADCDEAVRLSPQLAQAFDNRGMARFAKGETDGAIADYDEAIRLDPSFALAFLNRGIARGAKRDFDRALADYDDAIRLSPQLAQAFNNRGSIHRAKGDNDRAIADFDEAIRLDATSAGALYNRGSTWLAKDEYARAVADLDRAIALDPQFAPAVASRALARAAMGDDARAIADVDAAMRLYPDDHPDSRELRQLRGYAHFRVANYRAAARDLASVVRRQPADIEPVLWLYLARAHAGERDAMSRMRANARGLKSTEWPFPLARLYLDRRKPAQTLASAKSPAERCQAQFHVGEWHLLHRDRAAARRVLQAAADNCPKALAEYAGAVAELKRLGPTDDAMPTSSTASDPAPRRNKASASRPPRLSGGASIKTSPARERPAPD
jgi:tetratricopeptide (TPR) repeat protein